MDYTDGTLKFAITHSGGNPWHDYGVFRNF